MCTVYKKTLSLSRSGFKHANCLLSLTRWQSIPASVPSSMSWMNARYEATTVGRVMLITYNAICIIIHQGLENVETFSSRPRPRPRLFLQDQDQDHFSCPRGASRPRPRSRDYISGYNPPQSIYTPNLKCWLHPFQRYNTGPKFKSGSHDLTTPSLG